MLTITLRDLQWRARRFGLGVLATSLVFTATLLLAGVHASFRDEAARTVEGFSADRWIVPDGVSGPFTAASPVTADVEQRARAAAGVREAEAVVLFRHVARRGDERTVLNVIAREPGGLVRPPIVSGREARTQREAVLDERADVPVGATIGMGGESLRVVGHVRDLTYFGGTPTLLIGLDVGRRIAYGGQALATAVIVRGAPREPLAGLQTLDFDDVRMDLLRPMQGAISTIAVLALLLSAVAAGIVGLMVYLSGLDRLVDFAVFKAIGVRQGRLLGGLVLQALALALIAALGASLAATLLAPTFPIGVRLSTATHGALLGLAMVVGLLVSLVSIRQAARVEPALAFGRN